MWQWRTRTSDIIRTVRVPYTNLGIDTDGLAALFARISEDGLVTGDAVRVVVPQDVALSSQALVTLPTAEMLTMPVLVHGLGVFATENELKQ